MSRPAHAQSVTLLSRPGMTERTISVLDGRILTALHCACVCVCVRASDMLRKLALSGLLQFVHRGTAAQCFCGCAVAFLSFGLQQRLHPYRECESNALKSLVEMQLFLTFLISFILRVLPVIDSAEPVGAAVYGWVMVSSLVLLLTAAVGLTTLQIRRHSRKSGDRARELVPSLGQSEAADLEQSDAPLGGSE